MKYKLLLLASALFLTFTSFAQSQILFNQDVEESFIIEYTGGQNPITDALVNKLAQGNGIAVNRLHITFTFTENRKITKRGSQQILSAELDNIIFDNNAYYKGFFMDEWLLPSKLDLKVKRYKGRTLLETFTITDADLSFNQPQIVNISVPDTVSGSHFRMETYDKVFRYTQNDKRKFDKQIQLIDKYYTGSKQVSQKTRETESIERNPDALKRLPNLNLLASYRDDAQNALDFAEHIENQEYFKKLDLTDTDPAGLLDKLTNLKNISQELFDVCDDLLNHLDVLYLERGMDMLAARNPERADYFFNESIRENPRFAPAHYQLARLYYNGGLIDQAIGKIYQIREMTPDYQTKQQTDELARMIYSDLLLDAGGLNSDGRYDEAVQVLRIARELCESFPEVPCRTNMDDEYARAINGKFENILRNADNALNKNQLTDAENIINTAIDYRNSNRNFIRNDANLVERINNLYYKYIEIGQKNYRLNKYQNAVNAYEDAGRICNQYDEINCTKEYSDGLFDARTGVYTSQLEQAEKSYYAKKYNQANNELDEAVSYRKKYQLEKNTNEDILLLKIKQGTYNEHITSGKSANASKNYQEALSNFDKAKRIEANYKIRKNKYLNGYISKAAKSRCLQLINEGIRYVEVNNLSNARKKYGTAKDIETKYGLKGDKDLTRKFAELKDRIFAQECINAQNEYNDIYADALKKSNTRSYIECENLLGQALAHAAKNADCEIDTQNAVRKKKEIAPAAEYMRQIIDTDNALNNRQYRSAIGKYINAGKYFNANSIMRFGLKWDDLYTFIASKHDDFINYGVSYYTEKKNYDEAVSLLKLLSRHGFKKTETKNNQIALGTALASRDFSENPNGNYKSNTIRYTGNDSYFKYFKKAYKKQWKKLD